MGIGDAGGGGEDIYKGSVVATTRHNVQ